jgi:hypothetical protein
MPTSGDAHSRSKGNRSMYSDRISRLRNEIEVGGARPSVIDLAVNELMTEGDGALGSDLLSLLSDKAEHDEGMFSLIHGAESVDDNAYVQALLSVFPHLAESAPRWPSIVLMRVLNSEPARAELVRRLRSARTPVKEAVRVMCERINGVGPEFLSKTVPVIIASS